MHAARQDGRALEVLRGWVTCGGLMIAANCSTPNMPRLDIVKVPESKSVGLSLPSRACDIDKS